VPGRAPRRAGRAASSVEGSCCGTRPRRLGTSRSPLPTVRPDRRPGEARARGDDLRRRGLMVDASPGAGARSPGRTAGRHDGSGTRNGARWSTPAVAGCSGRPRAVASSEGGAQRRSSHRTLHRAVARRGDRRPGNRKRPAARRGRCPGPPPARSPNGPLTCAERILLELLFE
jgi:hypothetical protein